nr:hypothetical protein [Bacillus licheniformis]
MERKFSLVLFVLGWIVIVAGILTNIEGTLYLNANQFVADGETPKPVRMMEIVSDIIHPLYQGKDTDRTVVSINLRQRLRKN